MQQVVVLGGGVGGTLTANLIARKLKKQIASGEANVVVVDDEDLGLGGARVHAPSGAPEPVRFLGACCQAATEGQVVEGDGLGLVAVGDGTGLPVVEPLGLGDGLTFAGSCLHSTVGLGR